MLPEPETLHQHRPAHELRVGRGERRRTSPKRYEALKDHPLFAGLEYSEDASVIRSWAPLLIPGRKRDQPIAATRIVAGTDVDFGALTHLLLDGSSKNGAKLKLEHRVTRPEAAQGRHLAHQPAARGRRHARSRSAHGSSSSAPAAPRSTCCSAPASMRSAATAGSRSAASSCAPTILPSSRSTPRRSTARRPTARRRCPSRTSTPASSTARRACCSARTPASRRSSSRPAPTSTCSPSIRWHNLGTMIGAGLTNLSLVWYLVTELLATPGKKHRALRAVRAARAGAATGSSSPPVSACRS